MLDNSGPEWENALAFTPHRTGSVRGEPVWDCRGRIEFCESLCAIPEIGACPE